MRVVIDTNVLISGVFFGGPPEKILKAWHGGELQLVVILDELRHHRRNALVQECQEIP